MKNKQLAKSRGKRLARAFGGCRRCGRLATLRGLVPKGADAMWCPCPGCGAELRVTGRMLDDGDRVIIRRFAQCLSPNSDPCPHAFTVVFDGQVRRDDPPCDCGKERVMLDMQSAAAGVDD